MGHTFFATRFDEDTPQQRWLGLAQILTVVWMVWKANAFYLLIQERYRKPYPNPADIPPEKVADFKRLHEANAKWFAKAEALGWSQKTPEQEAKYMDEIKAEKAKRGQQ